MRIEDLPVLPIGSPHNPNRYCPEHILLVAAEACLANYALLISSRANLTVKGYQSSAEGELLEDDGGFRYKRITIRPKLTLEEGKEAMAKRVLEKAHDLCMVVRALNITVEVDARPSIPDSNQQIVQMNLIL